jgi:hypothetical protein
MMKSLRNLYRRLHYSLSPDEALRDQLYEAKMELIAYAAAAEYSAAMVDMLQKRIVRLQAQIDDHSRPATLTSMPAPSPLPTVDAARLEVDKPERGTSEWLRSLTHRATAYVREGVRSTP